MDFEIYEPKERYIFTSYSYQGAVVLPCACAIYKNPDYVHSTISRKGALVMDYNERILGILEE